MSAINQIVWERLLSTVFILMRTSKPMRLNLGSLQFLPVSIGDINNIQSNDYLENTSYMFTKHIRGTAAYWKSVLFKLLAMIKTLGIPDFFLTLSCNDNWPELQEMIQKDVPGSTVSNNRNH